MNARDRIMDGGAIGPEQFTVDAATFLKGRPSWDRDDPEPADFHAAMLRQDDQGSVFYSDLQPYGGGLVDADSDAGFGSLWQNVRAC